MGQAKVKRGTRLVRGGRSPNFKVRLVVSLLERACKRCGQCYFLRADPAAGVTSRALDAARICPSLMRSRRLKTTFWTTAQRVLVVQYSTTSCGPAVSRDVRRRTRTAHCWLEHADACECDRHRAAECSYPLRREEDLQRVPRREQLFEIDAAGCGLVLSSWLGTGRRTGPVSGLRPSTERPRDLGGEHQGSAESQGERRVLEHDRRVGEERVLGEEMGERLLGRGVGSRHV